MTSEARSDTRPRYVQVEARTRAATYEVDLELRTCTCRDQDRRSCAHLRRARDIFEGGCKQSHYELASSLHKEIRRGDLEAALYWADLRAQTSPRAREYLLSYIRRICGEETRNATVMWRCFEPEAGASYREFVAAITRSRKKWEHAATAPLFLAQMRGWQRVMNGTPRTRWRRRTFLATFLKAIADGDALAMHEGLWFFYQHVDESEDAAFEQLLSEEVAARVPAIPRPHEMIASFEQATGRDAFEIHSMFIEALSGGWDTSMNDFCHHSEAALPSTDTSILRRFPDYAYDVHVRRHRKRRARWQSKLEPGSPSPGRLDLRWSGQMLGVAWRYAAYVQHGIGYATKSWEDVWLTDKDWRLVSLYDRE